MQIKFAEKVVRVFATTMWRLEVGEGLFHVGLFVPSPCFQEALDPKRFFALR